jgi:hypothetical protein
MAGEAAQPEYNLDYQASDGSSVLTNVNFYGPGDRHPRADVMRSRASHTDRTAADAQRRSRTSDPRTLKVLEELADILACIFADAQASGKLDAPVEEQLAASQVLSH